MIIVQKDSPKRRRFHRSSVVQTQFTWLDCSNKITYRNCRGVGGTFIFWRRCYAPARKLFPRWVFDIHHETSSWLPILIVLVRPPAVFVVDGLRIVGPWLFFSNVVGPLGLPNKFFWWDLLVLGPPLTKLLTNWAVYAFDKETFQNYFLIDGAVFQSLRT